MSGRKKSQTCLGDFVPNGKPPFQSFARGVGHIRGDDPDSESPVARIDGASWNNKRPRGVPDIFQVSEHVIECQRDDASNVFAKDPSRSCECNDSAHFRPEMTVIRLGSLKSSLAEGLAGKSSGDKVDSSEPSQSTCVKRVNVIEAGEARPVFGEDGSTELVTLAEGNGSHTGSFKAKGKSSYTRK